MDIDLCDVLQASYGTASAVQQMLRAGYAYDSDLSSHNQQVWVRSNQVIVTIAGTHNCKDIITDIWLGLGRIKQTRRYKEADHVLEMARSKYATNSNVVMVVAGHSLGGAIAQFIASKTDIVFTLNKGATIGQQTRGNEFGIRTSGDVVSLMGAGATRMNTVVTPTNNCCRPLRAHAIENIRGKVFF